VALDLGSLFKLGSLRRRSGSGASGTPTYSPQNAARPLTLPLYREHLRDIYSERTTQADARSLLELMFRADPDTSAAVNAYLTIADTEAQVLVRGFDGAFDRDAYRSFETLKVLLAHQADLSEGYRYRMSWRGLCERLRYLALLRGAVAGELVFDKGMVPVEFRIVDPATVQWYERQPGQYKPVQKIPGRDQEISLDIPTFFHSWFRPSPLSIYGTPPFVAAINTIAARQQVINDLYRIMNMTGYPRIDVKVLEEVVRNAAPAEVRADGERLRQYVNSQINGITTAFSQVRPDQAFVHTDAVEVQMLNDKSPGVALQVEAIIGVLNAQNQAGLKTVSTILGRGESGVNTATIEARVFSLNADALNQPVAELLSRMITVALQLAGHPVYAEVRFRPSELRPHTELEPHLVMRQARLLEALSWGLITDEEFHLEMYGRPPPEGAPALSGTGFYAAPRTRAEEVSPNADPLGRALAPEGSDSARSNQVRPPQS
jgi:hypothetical protein